MEIFLVLLLIGISLKIALPELSSGQPIEKNKQVSDEDKEVKAGQILDDEQDEQSKVTDKLDIYFTPAGTAKVKKKKRHT